MQVLICSDAFKDAADAATVCQAIAAGVRQVASSTQIDVCPLADGGEGTARILSRQTGAEWLSVATVDPLGRPIQAGLGWHDQSRTAFLDMAEASGLQHLTTGERNPLRTSTFGTGLLLREAFTLSPDRIYLGIGGSATNDGGIGLAAALGYRFFAGNQRIEMPTGRHLSLWTHIDHRERHPFLAKADIQVLCDVRSPLLGRQGASHTYAPQKGATPIQVLALERGLARLNTWWTQHLGRSFAHRKGAGAAGGLGAGLMAFCGAQLVSGADTILEVLRVADRIRGKNLVITGEGRLDQQSLSGKLIGQLTTLTGALQVPLIVLCGQSELSSAELRRKGIHAAYVITPPGTPLGKALLDTPTNLTRTAAQVWNEWAV
mgnify:CR=1 FL=1